MVITILQHGQVFEILLPTMEKRSILSVIYKPYQEAGWSERRAEAWKCAHFVMSFSQKLDVKHSLRMRELNV